MGKIHCWVDFSSETLQLLKEADIDPKEYEKCILEVWAKRRNKNEV